MTLSSEQLTSLRKWASGHSPHVSAAVDLLAWHETWFRRRDFLDRCVSVDVDGIVWLNWTQARAAFDAGLRGSTSELAVLDLAIALGEDRYRFSIMGHAHREAIVQAVTNALT
jgi:hypothetical protein